MPVPGQGYPMPTAGAAGSMQGFARPGENGQGQQYAPPPGQAPQYQNPGYQPGHTAGGPPGAWQAPGAPNQTPLGVGYSGPQAPAWQGQQPQQQQQGQQAPQPQNWQQQAPQNPGYQQQPQGYQQPQQGQPQQQGGPVVQLQDDMILDGPNVPTELRGRPFRQVKAIYGALAQDWVRRQSQPPQQPLQFQGAPQGQQPQQPQQQAPQQRQQPAGYDPDFGYIPPRNGQPQGQHGQQQAPDMQSMIRAAVQEALAPVQQSLASSGLAGARQAAAQLIPDFQELEGDIMQVMSSASPDVLANPGAWETVADMVRGRRQRSMRTQQFNQRIQPQTPYGAPQQPYGQQGPGFVPTTHPGQFFSEGPMTPGAQTDVGLSPSEMVIARQFNMDPGAYANFKAGLQSRQQRLF